MRIRDILKEDVDVKLTGTSSEVEPDFDSASPGMLTFKELRNTDAYMQYRMGVAIAAAAAMGDHEFEQETPYAENMVFVTYTSAEDELIRRAAKIMGVTPTQTIRAGSTENKSTGKTSVFSKK
jgi:hypothetical protein